jgi:hypothetical protein
LAYWLNVRDKDAGLVVIAFILSFVNTVTLVANIAARVVYKQMQKKKQ